MVSKLLLCLATRPRCHHIAELLPRSGQVHPHQYQGQSSRVLLHQPCVPPKPNYMRQNRPHLNALTARLQQYLLWGVTISHLTLYAQFEWLGLFQPQGAMLLGSHERDTPV